MRHVLSALVALIAVMAFSASALAGSNMSDACVVTDAMRTAYLGGDTEQSKAHALKILARGDACSDKPLPPTNNVGVTDRFMIFFVADKKPVAMIMPVVWEGHPAPEYIMVWDPSVSFKDMVLARR